MAWNPSPEVAVVRDTAKAMGVAVGETVQRCVVIFTTANGQLGYASFGVDKSLCAEAKKMGDAAYKAIHSGWDDIAD